MLFCRSAYTLPVGNPASASLLSSGLVWPGCCCSDSCPCLAWYGLFSFRSGFYGDYVFNRHLQIDNNESDACIERARIFTNAAFLALNFWDKFDIFTTLGSSSIIIDTNSKTFTPLSNIQLEIETESHFSWSLGGRGTIWECGSARLGAEIQYFFTHPAINHLAMAAFNNLYPDNIVAKYSEWQIGIGISRRIHMFDPYFALKWSHAQISFDNAFLNFNTPLGFATLFDLENSKDLGYAIGISLIGCNKMSLNFEGRFSDEKALYMNGQIRF